MMTPHSRLLHTFPLYITWGGAINPDWNNMVISTFFDLIRAVKHHLKW